MFLRTKILLGVVAGVLVLSVVLAIALGVGLGVRLSAQDSHVFAASFRGLGLLPETSFLPAYWNISSLMDNTSTSHWTFPRGLFKEATNATTPAPSAAGDAADLNLGPYKFLIQAFTVNVKPYKSAVLTINIQQGAASFGTFDSTGAADVLGKSQSPSTWPGDTVLLSTGIDRTGYATNFGGLAFAKTVTITHADPARPGGIVSMVFTSSSNVLVKGVSFTGDINALRYIASVVQFGPNCTNMAAHSCNITFSPTTASNRPGLTFGGCKNCEATDLYARGIDQAIVDLTASQNVNITVTRARVRGFYNNAIWIANSNGMSLIDCVTMAPMRYTGNHIDHIQVADGASPQNLKIVRHMMVQAEGNAAAQGFFAGGMGIWEGFIDDGTGGGKYSGKPGNVLTIANTTSVLTVTPWTWIRGSNFSQLVQITSASSTGKIIGQYTIDQTLAAPLGRIHTAPFTNLVINGMAFMGPSRNALTVRGLDGRSSIKASTSSFIVDRPEDVPYSYLKGTVVGSVLNITEFQSGAPVGVPMFIQLANGTSLASTQGFVSSTAFLLGGSGFNYPTPIALRGSSDLPNQPNQGPVFSMYGVDIPTAYGGQAEVSSMYMWYSYPKGLPAYFAAVGGQADLPDSVTLNMPSMFINTANYTAAGLAFAHGDPQYGPMGLQTVPAAEWAKMSFDEVLRRHVEVLTPRVGGVMTSGALDFGAFTRDGLWNDGSGKKPYNL